MYIKIIEKKFIVEYTVNRKISIGCEEIISEKEQYQRDRNP